MGQVITISIPDVHGEGAETISQVIQTHASPSEVEVLTYDSPPASTDEWIDRTRHADGVMLGWKFPDDALKAAERLRAVSFLGTGIADQISLPICSARGVSTYVVSGYGDNAVAEHTVALLFSVWNSVPELNSSVHAGEWPSPSRAELQGSTLGIVGYGGIGRRVAEISELLGMRVLIWSRSLQVGQALPHGTAASLDDVLSQSDAISVHLALNPETERFIDAASFAQMKPGVVFINTARADIVDTEALVEAMRLGHVRGAGIDVFATEPVSLDNPLIGLPKAVLTPHVGYNTDNAVASLLRLGTLNLIKHFWPDRV